MVLALWMKQIWENRSVCRQSWESVKREEDREREKSRVITFLVYLWVCLFSWLWLHEIIHSLSVWDSQVEFQSPVNESVQVKEFLQRVVSCSPWVFSFKGDASFRYQSESPDLSQVAHAWPLMLPPPLGSVAWCCANGQLVVGMSATCGDLWCHVITVGFLTRAWLIST